MTDCQLHQIELDLLYQEARIFCHFYEMP